MNKTTQRLSYIFGLSMAFLMAVTLFLPGLAPRNTTTEITPEVTSSPPPATFPPPLTDFSGITIDEDYLHPSGLYALGVPTGWVVGSPTNNGRQAQISLNNSQRVSVIEVYVEQPTEPLTTGDELSTYFSSAALGSSWARYSSWTELARDVTEEDRLIIDFALVQNQQEFLAQHTAWTDGEWIYVVRVVVPNNSRDLLFHMRDLMVEQVKPNKQFAGSPTSWTAYYDQVDHHILRMPASWDQVDGGEGGPVSFYDAVEGTQIRVEAIDETTVADEDAARAYVENLRAGNEIVSVEPITRVGGAGFNVAYAFRSADGEPFSGFAVLLNGDDGALHVADVRLSAGGVDLNDATAVESYSDLVTALDTFSLLMGLDLPEPEPTPEPTAVLAETPEVEMTDEPTEMPAAEATDEPTEMPAVEATPEATEES